MHPVLNRFQCPCCNLDKITYDNSRTNTQLTSFFLWLFWQPSKQKFCTNESFFGKPECSTMGFWNEIGLPPSLPSSLPRPPQQLLPHQLLPHSLKICGATAPASTLAESRQPAAICNLHYCRTVATTSDYSIYIPISTSTSICTSIGVVVIGCWASPPIAIC